MPTAAHILSSAYDMTKPLVLAVLSFLSQVLLFVIAAIVVNIVAILLVLFMASRAIMVALLVVWRWVGRRYTAMRTTTATSSSSSSSRRRRKSSVWQPRYKYTFYKGKNGKEVMETTEMTAEDIQQQQQQQMLPETSRRDSESRRETRDQGTPSPQPPTSPLRHRREPEEWDLEEGGGGIDALVMDPMVPSAQGWFSWG